MGTKVLAGGTLIDGSGSAPVSEAAVVIEGERIIWVGRLAEVDFDPSQAEVLDLSGKAVLPGLIDMHVHLAHVPAAQSTGQPGYDGLLPTETLIALTARERARAALLAGLTSVRDMGAAYLVSLKVRDLIEAGLLAGPRICAAGPIISMTGGHAGELGLEVDSSDEARKVARQLIKKGVDCLKLAANGLGMDEPELTEAEMTAAVEAAHNAGVRVAAHASVWRGVENALRAGVDTIEHGCTINESFAQIMQEQGTTLVPTLATGMRIARIGADYDDWRDKLDVIHHRLETAVASARLAYEAGVKIGLGTDGSQQPLLEVGEIVPELEALTREVGMSNMDAVRAVTSVAAEGLGWNDRLGTIEPGKLADITVLNANPLEDIGAFGDVFMVIKGGATVAADGKLVEPAAG
ncbi:MAG TPA: amidohydrolase family protein [Anaerolineae bacterium]|nr:amidohydrolase family protein [Anaerolineae bacterium]